MNAGYGHDGNVLLANIIGLDRSATNPVPNRYDGIDFRDGSSGNTVGAGNVVAGNVQHGIYINGSATSGNVIQGVLRSTTTATAASSSTGRRATPSAARRPGPATPSATTAATTRTRGHPHRQQRRQRQRRARQFHRRQHRLRRPHRLGANDNSVGGTAAGAGNTIDANGKDSVVIDNWDGGSFSGSAGVKNAVLGNSMTEYAAGTNGIDLHLPTATDVGNHGQAAPVLSLAGSPAASRS